MPECRVIYELTSEIPEEGGKAVFGRAVNPIPTRGTDYVHHITTAPLRFLDGATSLWCLNNFK